MAITTAEELLRAQDIGRCELVRGELRMLAYRGLESGRVAARLGSKLNHFAESHGLGAVLSHVGFVLARGPDTVRAPDIAFIRAEPVAGRNPGYVEGAPDVAVEVLSEDPPDYVRDKVAEWLKAGAGAVWVVDPRDLTVTVHRARRKPVVLGEADTLRGDGTLGGFELAVREIFAP
jgi:Uma2 family endonuclease